MIKRVYIPIVILAIGFTVLFSSCATVFGGKKNRIIIEDGAPLGATVYLDGQRLGMTPIDTKLDKHLIQDGSQLEIRKAGFRSDTIVIKREVHPWYTFADIITGGIWLGIDLGTGNLYRPVDNKFTYELKKN